MKPELFFDLLSGQFDRQAGHFEESHTKTVEYTKKYLRTGDIILDYGCATGTVALEIADHVKEVHGIDISSRMITIAKRKAADVNTEKLNFTQSTIFDERLKRGSFDVILVFNILHFLDDIPEVMRRINELLKPGGFFISVTPCMGGTKTSPLIFQFLAKTGLLPPMKFFKASELEHMMTNENFCIVEIESLTPGSTNRFIVAKKV
ncbi:MAG TPA: methyltransferase domain-containing protein [Methanocella sp.]|nr:methyltransferase domain-containing protein [Methanocella sp.]